MIEGLKREGFEVVECHETLWQGFEDRVEVANGGWMNPRFWFRIIQNYAKLLTRFFKIRDYQAIIVGYPGHFDVFVAYLLSLIVRKPLVWDVFNSLYLMMIEQGVGTKSPVTIKLVKFFERLACRLPQSLILDNDVFIDWFRETHRINTSRFRTVQIGADDRYFYPIEPKHKPDGKFRVVYYGTYIPNHGVEYIIDAARLLADDPAIEFVMIGKGPEREKAEKLASTHQLKNVEFIDWIEWTQLSACIADMDLVLGAFGISKQLQLTNNNKIYEAFAMRKPVVSSTSAAMPSVLHHGEHLYLCERGSSQALANAIRTLKNDPALCVKLAENGHRVFFEHFDIAHSGARFKSHVLEIL